MKYLLLALLLSMSADVYAQDSQMGTTRSEDLKLKARMEYERRNQKLADGNSPNGAPTPAPGASIVGPQKSVTCRNGGEIRELYIEYKGQGCELFYIKQGATKSQARQNSGKSVCESVFEQIKTTVEKTGFTCEQKTN